MAADPVLSFFDLAIAERNRNSVATMKQDLPIDMCELYLQYIALAKIILARGIPPGDQDGWIHSALEAESFERLTRALI